MWLGPIVIMILIFVLHADKGLGTEALPAPQGQALASMIEGITGGNVPVHQYGAGAGLGALLSASGIGGLGILVGLGFYLPFNIVLTYTIGTGLRLLADWKKGKTWSEETGIPIAAGLLVGEALIGVGFAVYNVAIGIVMKPIGYALIGIGFMLGCWAAVLDAEVVDWTYFGVALGMGVVGVFLARLGTHREATDKDKLESNIKDIDASMTLIVEHVHELRANKGTIDVYDLPDRIEDRIREPINTFVEAREAIIHVYGLNVYADAMSMFAAGERYINRVWSAAVEGYIDEAHTYIDKSADQFDAARAKIEEAKAAKAQLS